MFETFKMNEVGFNEVAEFKTKMNVAVTSILKLLPDGRDKSIFMTKLEEAMFFGTRAIASKEGNFSSIEKYLPPRNTSNRKTK